MYDIHCHILPEVDDGARSWDMAVQMCAMAWQDGIKHMVATPHCNDEFLYERPFLEEILEQLRQRTDGKPELSLGCDFHFNFENIQDALANPTRFTIARTPYILIEFSDFSIPPSMDEQLEKLMKIGLRPILTHPERNPILQKTPARVVDMVRGGSIVQVTANSLTGRWGKKADACARWLLSQNAVHVIATDAHSLDSRPPILSGAWREIEKMEGDLVADALTILNPKAIIQGQEIPFRPPA